MIRYQYTVDDNENITTDFDMTNYKTVLPPDVQKVIMTNDTVVVTLHDGSKGVAHCMEGDTMDNFVGFCVAYFKAKSKCPFEVKRSLNKCADSAKRKSYRQAVLINR